MEWPFSIKTIRPPVSTAVQDGGHRNLQFNIFSGNSFWKDLKLKCPLLSLWIALSLFVPLSLSLSLFPYLCLYLCPRLEGITDRLIWHHQYNEEELGWTNDRVLDPQSIPLHRITSIKCIEFQAIALSQYIIPRALLTKGGHPGTCRNKDVSSVFYWPLPLGNKSWINIYKSGRTMEEQPPTQFSSGL